MVVCKDKPITMPRPFGGEAPTITVEPRSDGESGTHYTVQISGVIESPYQFLEFIQLLQTADEEDIIDVKLNTPGGCVFTTQVLLNWMNSSKAKVTTYASGLVASAGTFLWFYSKNHEVDDWSTFMFHSSSHGDRGKSIAIKETSTSMVTYMETIVKAMIAKGILTAEEAGKIFRQKKDLFLPGTLIRARMLEAIASTESLKLRAEDDPEPGEDSQNDRPNDPEGNPDEDAHDDIDGDKTPIDPAAWMRAEGVETGDGTGDGGSDDDDDGDGDGDDDDEGNPEGRCGKGKKKAKKGKKRVRGEGTDDDSGVGDGDDDGSVNPGTVEAKKGKKKAKKRVRGEEGEPGSEENPVDPSEADSPDAYLKW